MNIKKLAKQYFVTTLNGWLFLVIFGSLIASLSYSFFYKIPPAVDAKAYDAIAINLVQGKGFREVAGSSWAFETSIVRAGPAYEFFLAGLYGVFGRVYSVVWVAQALLHAGTAFLIYKIAQLIFKDLSYRVQIGVLASFMFGFHPDLIEISAMLLTETLYLFFTALTIYLFAHIYQSSHSRCLILFWGFSTGLAILTRPTVIFFIPVFFVFFLKRGNFWGMSYFFGGLGAALMPWIVRNYIVYHQFIATTLIGEYNIWIGNTLRSVGGQISEGPNPVTTYIEQYGAYGFKAQAKKEFYSFVVSHPFVFIKLTFLRFVRFFSLLRPMGFWFYQQGIKQIVFVACSAISIAILFISGLAGALELARQKKTLYWYLLILAMSVPLPLFLSVVQSRYRFQIYPFFSLFGAFIIISVWKENLVLSKKIVIFVILFFLAISFTDVLVFLPTIISHIDKLIK